MKILVLGFFILLGIQPLARDYEYNERRDIVIPMNEQWERIQNMTPEEWEEEKRIRDENMERYARFHWELERSDKGENSER